MANSIEDLENLPEIDLLDDFGITLDGIQEDMIICYQDKYRELSGKECTLYPANPNRLIINAVAGQIYQAYEFINYAFKQNFIRYMEDETLWNWGATLGFAESSLKSATCTLEFGVNEPLDFDVSVPIGTRVTAGDDVFFASDADCVIKAGKQSIEVSATCTEEGAVGNDYVPGQINIIADPVPNLSHVRNIDLSAGGADELSGDSLREKIFLFPSTYSVAGPEGAYEYFVKKYSEDIIDAKVVTDKDSATVMIYIMLENGVVPDEAYCQKVEDYLLQEKKHPDTDKISVQAPLVVSYDLKAAYYISTSKRDNEITIRKSVEEAAAAYVKRQSECLGYDINPDIFREYARVAGAKRIVLETPAYTKLEDNQIAICKGINLVYGGLEDD